MVAILGPTASGKSDVAMRLAVELGAEILSIDSMQVYTGMDIGTAKPSPSQQSDVRHHMIDIVPPDVDYTVAEFQAAGKVAVDEIRESGRQVLIVGGSGLHFRSIVDPLEFPPSDTRVRAAVNELADVEAVRELLAADADAGAHVDLANPRRVQRAVEIIRLGGQAPSKRASSEAACDVRSYVAHIPFVGLGLEPHDALPGRISARVGSMLNVGLLDEIAALADSMGRNAGQAVGYKELAPVARGELDLAQGTRDAIAATLALAKRQRTFFRRDPRIQWMAWNDDPDVRYRRVVQALEEAPSWIS